MSCGTLYDKVSDITGEEIQNAKEVKPEELGLDPRAGYKLWVGKDYIAVEKGNDRMLQYYGGFEYIDGEHRMEAGGFVFYSEESDRVAEHLTLYRERLTQGSRRKRK